MMTEERTKLRDVKDKSGFQAWYEEHGLADIRDKIAVLWAEMGILRSTGYDFTPEEELLTLQLHALVGWDRAPVERELKLRILADFGKGHLADRLD